MLAEPCSHRPHPGSPLGVAHPARTRPGQAGAAALLLLAGALAGCAGPARAPASPATGVATASGPAAWPARPPAPPPLQAGPVPASAAPLAADDSAQAVLTLLHEAQRLALASPAELAREAAQPTDGDDTPAETLLRVALALAQMRQPVDTARALGLAQRAAARDDTAAQRVRPLALWLESRLLQQRRIEEQLDRTQQQLRDAQRRNEQLQERLDALRAIERSLTARPLPPAAPRGMPR